jgi:hypothetical protein
LIQVGRPVVFALAAEGEAGVRNVLRMLREEFELTMALSGCTSLAEINRSHVFTEGDRLRPKPRMRCEHLLDQAISDAPGGRPASSFVHVTIVRTTKSRCLAVAAPDAGLGGSIILGRPWINNRQTSYYVK